MGLFSKRDVESFKYNGWVKCMTVFTGIEVQHSWHSPQDGRGAFTALLFHPPTNTHHMVKVVHDPKENKPVVLWEDKVGHEKLLEWQSKEDARVAKEAKEAKDLQAYMNHHGTPCHEVTVTDTGGQLKVFLAPVDSTRHIKVWQQDLTLTIFVWERPGAEPVSHVYPMHAVRSFTIQP